MSLKVCFFASDKPRERLLASAFEDGIHHLGKGDKVEIRQLTPEVQIADADVAIMVGVKSRELYYAHWRAGIHVIVVDKGYTRHAATGPVKLWEYWRCAVDAHHPTDRLMSVARPFDRLDELGVTFKPWRTPTPEGHILIAGSSQKYHDFYGMKDPTRWATKVLRELRRHTERPVHYRPKPSWREAVPIPGTTWSAPPEQPDVYAALEGAHAMVTHGSNACFESILAGVPVIVLGEAVAKPISSHDLAYVNGPHLVSMPERRQWAANLAYCQWTMAEFASGLAWRYLRPQIYG